MDLFKASFLSYISLDFKKFGIDMVSFPGLKKDLCEALKKAMGMECRGRHIHAVAQWLPSSHSHTAPIWRRPFPGHSCMFSSGSA